jgi:hypothetical protein
MARVESISAVLQREVADYALGSPNSTAYYVENSQQQVYAVLVVPQESSQKSTIMIMARVVDDKVIIETDKTDHPLYEALIQAGIPQQQIVLAYAGETQPMA